MLYNFEHLARHLTELGYPSADVGNARIARRDLTMEEKAGNVAFKEDGIYLTINGTELKGYMHLKDADVVQYGLPKFHIANCKTVQEQRATGRFDGRYIWSNSAVVEIIDRQTRSTQKDVKLSLCFNCQRLLHNNRYSDTEGFYNLLDSLEQHIPAQEIQLDILGYTYNWKQISSQYKKERNYTCEKCGIRMVHSPDKRYMHTHHRNGDKTNNARSNLQALCVLCHSHNDAAHLQNFHKKRMQRELAGFIKKYDAELKLIGNEYINMKR